MTHYIDKDALEAEIKKVLDYKENEKTKWYNNCPNNPRLDGEIATIKGINYILKNIDVIELDPKSPVKWSEDDEKMLDAIILDYKGEIDHLSDDVADKLVKPVYEQRISWLKSLRPQPNWKPSEEQMKALNEIINTLAVSKHPHENDYLFNILNGLRKSLKSV